MTTGDANVENPEQLPRRFTAAEVTQLFQQHHDDIARFLLGVTGDAASAADAAQAAFVSALETTHAPKQESQKAWLFQVAYRAALATRRREARSREILAQAPPWQSDKTVERPDIPAARLEEAALVRRAFTRLPPDQQIVVRMRIEQNKTFAAISAELNIPIPTALSRMQAALKRLRSALGDRFTP